MGGKSTSGKATPSGTRTPPSGGFAPVGGGGGGAGSFTQAQQQQWRPGNLAEVANYWPSASEIIARSREASRANSRSVSGNATPLVGAGQHIAGQHVGSLVHKYQTLQHAAQVRDSRQVSPGRGTNPPGLYGQSANGEGGNLPLSMSTGALTDGNGGVAGGLTNGGAAAPPAPKDRPAGYYVPTFLDELLGGSAARFGPIPDQAPMPNRPGAPASKSGTHTPNVPNNAGSARSGYQTPGGTHGGGAVSGAGYGAGGAATQRWVGSAPYTPQKLGDDSQKVGELRADIARLEAEMRDMREYAANARTQKESELQRVAADRDAALEQCKSLAAELTALSQKSEEASKHMGIPAAAAAVAEEEARAASEAVNAARAALALKEAEVESATLKLLALARSVQTVREQSSANLAEAAAEVSRFQAAAATARHDAEASAAALAAAREEAEGHRTAAATAAAALDAARARAKEAEDEAAKARALAEKALRTPRDATSDAAAEPSIAAVPHASPPVKTPRGKKKKGARGGKSPAPAPNGAAATEEAALAAEHETRMAEAAAAADAALAEAERRYAALVEKSEAAAEAAEGKAAALEADAAAARDTAERATARVDALERELQLLRETTRADAGPTTADAALNDDAASQTAASEMTSLAADLEHARKTAAAAEARLEIAEASLASSVKTAEERARKEAEEAIERATMESRAASAARQSLQHLAFGSFAFALLLLLWVACVPSAGVPLVPYLLRLPGPGGASVARLAKDLAGCSELLSAANKTAAAAAAAAAGWEANATRAHERIVSIESASGAQRARADALTVEAAAAAAALTGCEARTKEATRDAEDHATAMEAATRRARELQGETAKATAAAKSLERKLGKAEKRVAAGEKRLAAMNARLKSAGVEACPGPDPIPPNVDESQEALLRRVTELEALLNASDVAEHHCPRDGGTPGADAEALSAARGEADRLRALLEEARESFGAAVTERDHAVAAAETEAEDSRARRGIFRLASAAAWVITVAAAWFGAWAIKGEEAGRKLKDATEDAAAALERERRLSERGGKAGDGGGGWRTRAPEETERTRSPPLARSSRDVVQRVERRRSSDGLDTRSGQTSASAAEMESEEKLREAHAALEAMRALMESAKAEAAAAVEAREQDRASLALLEKEAAALTEANANESVTAPQKTSSGKFPSVGSLRKKVFGKSSAKKKNQPKVQYATNAPA